MYEGIKYVRPDTTKIGSGIWWGSCNIYFKVYALGLAFFIFNRYRLKIGNLVEIPTYF
jgi:hypothetical protein